MAVLPRGQYKGQFLDIHCWSFIVWLFHNDKGLNIQNISNFYKTLLKCWICTFDFSLPKAKTHILKEHIFGNVNIKFKRQPLFFPSFTKSGIYLIEHIWDVEANQFKRDDLIYRQLLDKRNCISELQRIKKAIPALFLQILRNNENESTEHRIRLDENLFFKDNNDKIIMPNKLKLFLILTEVNNLGASHPHVQDTWNQKFNLNLSWKNIWQNIQNHLIPNNVQVFQWKCIHNAHYLEDKIRIFGNSNGRCHFCKTCIETNQHLFFQCPTVKEIVAILETKLNEILTDHRQDLNLPFTETQFMFGYTTELNNKRLKHFINFCIYSTKWSLWKMRNDIKFNQKIISVERMASKVIKDISSQLFINIKSNKNKPIVTFLKSVYSQW